MHPENEFPSQLFGLFKFLFLAFLLSSLVLHLGCTAAQKPSKLETALANMAKDVVIPIEAKGLQNPLPKDAEVFEQGRQLYVQYCTLCHDADGHAQAKLGQSMYPPAMDLTSPHVQGWGESELFWIIQNGVRLTGMPSWKGTLSDEEIWKLVRFIQGLPESLASQQPPQPAGGGGISQTTLIARGKTLYRQEGCFMCHQLNGEGGKVGPDLTVEGARGRTDEWLTGHFRNPTAFTKGSIMPAFKNLTDAQLQALVLFLQSQKRTKN